MSCYKFRLSWPGYLVLFAFLALAGPSALLADSYRIGFAEARADDDGALRLATVVASLTPRAGEVGLFRAGSDTGLYHQWATFVLNIEAEDSHGQPLDIVYQPNGAWKLPAWKSGEVTVRYSMLLQHDRFPNEPGDDELAAAHPYGVFWTTRALLLEGQPAEQIRVDFDLPDDWQVTTPWKPAGTKSSFIAKNTDDLLDAAFMAGRHEQILLSTGQVQARLALGPPLLGAREIFVPLLESYLGRYSALFGQGPQDAILLVARDASFFGGGVIGRSISLSIPAGADLAAAAPIASYIISHESFHLWNVQWGIDGESGNELEWLSEGTAEYYSLLTGLRLGHIDEQTFLSLLAERYGKYLNALESGKTLVTAADSKLGSAASYDLIYSGGELATLLIDLGIRKRHDNRQSADDLFRGIHARAIQPNSVPLTLSGLGEILDHEFQFDLESVIQTSIRGHHPLPLKDLLLSVGIEISIRQGDTISVSLERVSDPNRQQQQAWLDWTE